MGKPRMLDLFCGAGGAAMGYYNAGFHVTGVDSAPQPRYPFTFHQSDALEFLTSHGHEFDAIHASPPCQDHSIYVNVTGKGHGTGHLLADVRAQLLITTTPWVIENVPGAPMRGDFILCGCQFPNLPGLRRKRLFETNWGSEQPRKCKHAGMTITVAGGGGGGGWAYRRGWRYSQSDKNQAMGIDWMVGRELNQAIPPSYTEYVGRFLMQAVNRPRLLASPTGSQSD